MLKLSAVWLLWPFPGSSFISFDGLSGKETACNAGSAGSISGLGRSVGEGNGNTLQYSCLENPMDRGAWGATVHRIAELDTTAQMHMNIYKYKQQVVVCSGLVPLLPPCLCSGLGFSSPNIHPSAFGNPLFFRTSSKSLSFMMFPFRPQLQMSTASPFAICLYISSR